MPDDHLERLAQEEINRRLRGGRSMFSAVGAWLISALAWVVGLAAIGIAVLFLAPRIGEEKYVLECPGAIATPGDTATAIMYLSVTEYGPVVGLWSDQWGVAEAESPGHGYYFFSLEKLGLIVSLDGVDDSHGIYSPLSRSLDADLFSGGRFSGTCSRRP